MLHAARTIAALGVVGNRDRQVWVGYQWEVSRRTLLPGKPPPPVGLVLLGLQAYGGV